MIDDTLAPPASGGGKGAPIWSAATLPWRLTEIAAAGALAGVLMVLLWLTPRPDLSVAAAHPFFWIKATYPAAVAACALAAATGLARGRQSGVAMLAVAGALAFAMLTAAAIQAAGMAPAALAILIWPDGATCLGDILVIAAPMLVLTVAGLRAVDLPRPAPTGFACGLFSGGVAATVYGLHCWQGTYAFVGPWFTLAMLVSGGLGAGAIKLLVRRRRFLAAE
ncbi:NrsF family protein [Caulobacter sp. RL271]|uniref:NrsF family protein n=1 Tax=Caulobacter segnis TaxID=88688 RepID=A0ABY4ZWK4_9CAUL|nr:NrsF family protein [Caulobacter segnis]USQ96865.1 NrsF family protein [Caulobacter segnis]